LAWRARDLHSLAAFCAKHASIGALEISTAEPEFAATARNAAALKLLMDHLPAGCTSLQLRGWVAAPYAAYAAAQRLRGLRSLTLQQLPFRWSYQEGALPWPQGLLLRPGGEGGEQQRAGQPPGAAEAPVQQQGEPPGSPPTAAALARRLGRLSTSAGSPEAGAGEQLRAARRRHEGLYGAPVYRRFSEYWESYSLAAGHLLAAAGRGLRELHLEAPARTLGLDLVA
jgi:hypothetical protein